jgi:hypothetical protein
VRAEIIENSTRITPLLAVVLGKVAFKSGKPVDRVDAGCKRNDAPRVVIKAERRLSIDIAYDAYLPDGVLGY